MSGRDADADQEGKGRMGFLLVEGETCVWMKELFAVLVRMAMQWLSLLVAW